MKAHPYRRPCSPKWGKAKFNFKTAAKPQQIPYSFVQMAYNNSPTPCPTYSMTTTIEAPLPPKFKLKIEAKPQQISNSFVQTACSNSLTPNATKAYHHRGILSPKFGENQNAEHQLCCKI